MGRVVEPLLAMGARIDGRDSGRLPPLAVRGGGLHGIDYTLPVASAQVKGAVLLAGLCADAPTTVRSPHASRVHTEEMLAERGVKVTTSGDAVTIRPGPVEALDTVVPGDPSQAAFWVVAACITPGSDLTVENIYLGPHRAGFLDVLKRMGATIELVDTQPQRSVGSIRARYSDLVATEVGGDEIPGLIDEIPVLAVAAACAEGITEFRDAAELRVKESDRIATVTEMLTRLGIGVESGADHLVVRGGRLQPGEIDSHGDHRIAMAGAVAATAIAGETRVRGWRSVATSYPEFTADLTSLAGAAS
jgi:3-phosphoshikimate 1-carboxyvinyltransferase